MTELLPCPFCGGSATMEQTDSNRWSVGCDNGDEPTCMGYQSLTTFNRQCEASEAWNRRSRVPAQDAATPVAIEAGAQALANDVWHPPQRLESLPGHDVNKFRRQARLVLEAASSIPLTGLPAPAPHAEVLSGCAVRAAIQMERAETSKWSENDRHFLNAITHRLGQLHDVSDDPRLREQISDEIDWIETQYDAAIPRQELGGK